MTSSVLVTKVVLLSLGYFLEVFKSLGLRDQPQEALHYWCGAEPGKAHSAFQL